MQINSVYPWGRSLEEYTRMFSLSEHDLKKRILDCGGGPASFNAETTAQGRIVVSCDPLYQFTAAEIERRVNETHGIMVEKVRVRYDDFVWDYIRSPQHLGEVRLRAAQLFLQDFEDGKKEHRYVQAELPALPFDANSFDLAVVSHLLFLYSSELSLEFHLASLRELLRIAPEVRVYPLYSMELQSSSHVDPAILALRQEGFSAERLPVAYEYVRGAKEMLVLKQL